MDDSGVFHGLGALKQSDQCLSKGQKDIPRIIFFGWYLPTLWVFFERISCSQVTSWYVGKDWNGKKRSGMDLRLCQSALYFFFDHCVTIVHLAGKEAKGIPVSKHLQNFQPCITGMETSAWFVSKSRSDTHPHDKLNGMTDRNHKELIQAFACRTWTSRTSQSKVLKPSPTAEPKRIESWSENAEKQFLHPEHPTTWLLPSVRQTWRRSQVLWIRPRSSIFTNLVTELRGSCVLLPTTHSPSSRIPEPSPNL